MLRLRGLANDDARQSRELAASAAFAEELREELDRMALAAEQRAEDFDCALAACRGIGGFTRLVKRWNDGRKNSRTASADGYLRLLLREGAAEKVAAGIRRAGTPCSAAKVRRRWVAAIAKLTGATGRRVQEVVDGDEAQGTLGADGKAKAAARALGLLLRVNPRTTERRSARARKAR